MCNHHGPECIVPDDQRCEALAKGTNNYFWNWAKVDRRCSKRAQQYRDGIPVCHVHANIKVLTKYEQAYPIRWH